MKRRQFLQTGSLVSLPVLLGGLKVSAISNASFFNLVNADTDHVLVIIQLSGGNDGLNMIIPIDQYSGLSKVRPSIMIPESSVLKLIEKTGIHPSMGGLQQLFKDDKLAVIQSVGYPNQNRSHFRSTDIWTSGSGANQFLPTGWVGRYLDIKYPGYPTGYPNDENPDPFAITLGSLVSETCQGSIGNYSFTLTNEASVKLVEETVASSESGTCYSSPLDFVRNTIKQSNAYATTVLQAFDKGNNIQTYPDSNLAGQLKVVANLISGGLKTKVYVCNIGGFDTHANQVTIGETESGNHADLLGTISDAVSAFVADCQSLGIGERVVGMTFSEFGRQIIANNSFGTDHGTAAPLLVFGSCVKAGVYGDNPSITDSIAPQEGVPMQFDFRSIYASLLVDWLGVNETDIKKVLLDDFQKISFIEDCSSPSSVQENITDITGRIYPNPCIDFINFTFDNNGNHVNIGIYDALGALLSTPMDNQLASGNHDVRLNVQSLVSGTYFIRITIDKKVKVFKFSKV